MDRVGEAKRIVHMESPMWLVGMVFGRDRRIWIWGFGVTLFSLKIRPGYSATPGPRRPESLEFSGVSV